MRLAALAIVATLVAQTPAKAQIGPYSAESVLPGCRNATDPAFTEYKHGICFGVIAAALLYADALANPLTFCPPADIDTAEAVALVVRRLDTAPESWKFDFRELVITILQREWPCKR
jgi:hypothetical protein